MGIQLRELVEGSMAMAAVACCCLLSLTPGRWLIGLAFLPCLVWGLWARGCERPWLVRLTVPFGIILPLTLCFATLVMFTLVDRWPLQVVLTAFGAGFLVYLALCFRRRRRGGPVRMRQDMRASLMLFLGLWMIIYGTVMIIDLNTAYEPNPSILLHGGVVNRDPPHGKIGPRLWLAGAPNALGIGQVSVDRGLFDRSPIGVMVCVRVHQGWLGIRWYGVEAC